jgi:CRP-like cAMP-binding protein
MNEYDLLKKHIENRVVITDDELEDFTQSFKAVKVKKRQLIVQPEFVAKNRFYVAQGSFRAYIIGDDGNEHTIQFAIADWWISDYNSYIFQQPASMFIVALEDSILLQISYEEEQMLKNSQHVYEKYFRILAEHTAAYMARRVIISLTKTAEQRYEIFLSRYPDIVNKVPQYALASFLGMTSEYLSKLRKRRVSKVK